ncbi:hypothetical protein [Nocardia africana]
MYSSTAKTVGQSSSGTFAVVEVWIWPAWENSADRFLDTTERMSTRAATRSSIPSVTARRLRSGSG